MQTGNLPPAPPTTITTTSLRRKPTKGQSHCLANEAKHAVGALRTSFKAFAMDPCQSGPPSHTGAREQGSMKDGAGDWEQKGQHLSLGNVALAACLPLPTGPASGRAMLQLLPPFHSRQQGLWPFPYLPI